MVTIRTATVADRPQLADTFASAFSEDPLFAWMCGPKAPLEARMRVFFDALVKSNLRRQEHLVFIGDDGTGGAIWRPVDQWKVPPADLLRGLLGIARAFRGRVPTMLGALNTIERHHPEEPHYYLEVLGTRKDRQSKGVGSAVIGAMLERCDEEGMPAYLESSNLRNVPFYARHGFEVREELSCGKGAPVCTTMWREPRG
jgi:GNAT superfamily N-acetyltransferase